jgi:PAS domain S-box-containing protein
LNLFQKQILIVAVLLVFELVVLGAVQVLVQRAETEADRAENTSSIVALSSALMKDVWQMGNALIAFGLSRNELGEQRYEELRKEVPGALESIRLACLTSGSDLEYVQQISTSAHNLLDIFDECNEMLQHREEPGAMSRSGNLLKSRLTPALNHFFTLLNQFAQEHKKLQVAQKAAEVRAKLQVRMMLSLAICLQLLFAIAAVFAVRRSVTGRIHLLADNASRLARGETLRPPARPPVGGADEIFQLDVVFHDMARALAESAERERAVVDAMPVGFITLDDQGRIESVNPRATLLLRCEPEAVKGKLLSTLIAPGKGATHREFDFNQLSEHGLGRVSEYEFVRLDGSTFPGELSINTVVNSSQRLFVCNLLDVTERHEIERMKKEFVSIVSHDLKTPLTSIQSSLGLVAKGTFGTLDGAGQKVIKAGQEEALRLIKLINDLLDLARIEAGRIDLECEEVEVSDVVRRAVQSVEGFARERGVELLSEPITAQLWADEDRLLQVLVNLLSNAVKFSNRGEAVRICGVTKGDQLEIRVIDNGSGISEAAQRHIFERFVQISSRDRKEKGGTGLGLAICKLIIEAHGGEIGVESKLNRGSTFWFRLCMQPAKMVGSGLAVGRSNAENSLT